MKKVRRRYYYIVHWMVMYFIGLTPLCPIGKGWAGTEKVQWNDSLQFAVLLFLLGNKK
jgi:hypothetical protein